MNEIIETPESVPEPELPDTGREQREFLEAYREWQRGPRSAAVFEHIARECKACIAVQQPYAKPYATRITHRCTGCGRRENDPFPLPSSSTKGAEDSQIADESADKPASAESAVPPASVGAGTPKVEKWVACVRADGTRGLTEGQHYLVTDEHEHGFGPRTVIRDDRGIPLNCNRDRFVEVIPDHLLKPWWSLMRSKRGLPVAWVRSEHRSVILIAGTNGPTEPGTFCIEGTRITTRDHATALATSEQLYAADKSDQQTSAAVPHEPASFNDSGRSPADTKPTGGANAGDQGAK